jgi:hypothetical protein
MSDFLTHLERIQDELDNVYGLTSLSNWVEKHAYLEGKRFSFTNYEFQRRIMDDPARVVNTVKAAQLGLTVTTMMYLLAVLATQRMSVIYALPSANDAQKLVTTKLNPIIYNTPELKRLLNVSVDSTELKEINGNFLFTRGTKSETAALSISADVLVVDELDRCDPDTLKQFRSRLQASPHKIIRQFSTPTIDGLGISREAEASVRYRHFCTCAHCEHRFLPSYWTDIVVPDYDRPLGELDRLNLKDVKWKEARWNCPNCGRDPELDASRLEWVPENPNDSYEASTYYVGPITAHKTLKPDYLVRSSTEFNTLSEFKNQVLGETSQEESQQLVPADLEKAFTTSPLDSSELHCLGVDIGQMCAVTVGRLTQDGDLLVVHKEMTPLANLETRKAELARKYRVVTSVLDIMPETHLVGRITEYDPNAWAGMFTTSKTTELYTTQQKQEDAEEGKLNLRMVKINRTAMLDKLLDMFKKGKVVVARNQESGRYMSQLLSLKRTQVMLRDELAWSWVKTDNLDHYHFATMYLLTACLLRGTAAGWTAAGAVPLVSSFRMRSA